MLAATKFGLCVLHSSALTLTIKRPVVNLCSPYLGCINARSGLWVFRVQKKRKKGFVFAQFEIVRLIYCFVPHEWCSVVMIVGLGGPEGGG